MTITDPGTRVRRRDGAPGAEVETGDLAALISDPDALDELTGLVDRHGVVVIGSDTPVAVEAITTIARRLGHPEVAGDRPGVVPGSGFVGDLSARARPDDGRPRTPAFIEDLHYDTIGSRPAPYSVLHTRRVPPTSAQVWVDMGSVLAALPASLRSLVTGRRAQHGLLPFPDAPIDSAPAFDREKASRQPLVARHRRTGRPVLYLPRNPQSTIEGLPDEEGRAVLADLWARVTASPDRYERVLRSNEVVIWDGLATVHTNPPYPRNRDREIWFLTVPDDRPLDPHPG